MRLPKKKSDILTHAYKIPSISTADDKDDAYMYYRQALFEIKILPSAIYLKKSNRDTKRGETLEQSMNRWLQEAVDKGTDGIYMLDWKATIGNQTINSKALQVVRLVNPEDAPPEIGLKIAGQVIQFPNAKPDKKPTGPHVKWRGIDLYLSDSFPLLSEIEESENPDGGARLIDMGGNKYRYVWVLDIDKDYLGMWRWSDGDDKFEDRAYKYSGHITRLDRKGQLNRLSHREYNKFVLDMGKKNKQTLKDLQKWVEDTKTDHQREADRLMQQYYDKYIKRDLDKQMAIADLDIGILGFKVQTKILQYIPIERQRRSYIFGRVFEKYPLNKIEDWMEQQRFDLNIGDIQAPYWAYEDLKMAASDYYLSDGPRVNITKRKV